MANVSLAVSADSPAAWRAVLPKLTFYAEEADIRLDAPGSLPATDDLGKTLGVRGLKVPAPNVSRLHDIVTKAGLIGVKLEIRPIPNDPAETEIQAKLFRGGDTSTRAKELTDRALPSSHPRYREADHARTLKEKGRRIVADAEGNPIYSGSDE